MEKYIAQLLDPFDSEICGMPSEYPTLTQVVRQNYSVDITSSNLGHCLFRFIPQTIDSISSFFAYWRDGTQTLNVFNLLTVGGGTLPTASKGPVRFPGVSYFRLLSFGIKIIPIMPKLTESGKYVGCMFKAGPIFSNVGNIYKIIETGEFSCQCKGSERMFAVWYPMDLSDLKFRSTGDSVDSDKGSDWGNICFAGFGFPPLTSIFNIDVAWTVEFMPSLRIAFRESLELSPSPIGDVIKALVIFKKIANYDHSHLIRKLNG